MGGIIGRLFREFGVTIATAILISGFVSLTLTPMLCSRFLRPEGERAHGRIYNALERFLAGALRRLRDRPAVVAVPRPVRDGVPGRGARRHGRACSRRSRRASCRARTPGGSSAAPRRRRASPSTTWSRTSARSRIIVAADENVESFMSSCGSRGSSAGQHRLRADPPQAALAAQAVGRPGDPGAAAQAGAGARHHDLPAEPAADPHRRPHDQEPVPVHAADHRHRQALPLRAGAAGRAGRPARAAGRDQRHAAEQPAGRRWTSTATARPRSA